MIRFDVNEEAGIQWVAEGSGDGGSVCGGGGHTKQGAVLFLSINCVFPEVCHQEITPFYMLISLH